MNNVELTSKDINKSLMRFSGPLLLTSAMSYLAVFIDLSWLMALTNFEGLPTTLKVSLTTVGLVESLFAGILSAIYIFANRYFGESDHSKTQHLIATGFGYCLLLGVVVPLVGSVMSDALISLFKLGASETDMVNRYLTIFWFGYCVVLLDIYTGLLLKMSGNVSALVKLKVFAFVVNLCITPAFIYGAIHFGYDPIKAAALSTVFSRLCSFTMSIYKIHQLQVFPFSLGITFRPNRTLIEWKELIMVGLSESFNGLSLSLSFFLFFMVVSFYQGHVLEAVVISQYVTGFIQTLLLGVMGGLIPFVAQNAGKQENNNIILGVNWMVIRAFIVGVVLMIPFMVFAKPFANLLVNDAFMLEQIQLYILITAIPWVFLLASFAYIFAVIGLADSKGILWMTIWSMYLSTLLPLVVTSYLFGDNTLHMAIAVAASYVLTFFGCWSYYYMTFQRKIMSPGPVLVADEVLPEEQIA